MPVRWCDDDPGPCHCNVCPNWNQQRCGACGRPYSEHVDELRDAEGKTMATPSEFVIIDTTTGLYLERYDPDYRPEGADPADPRTGLAEWTSDLGRAMRFPGSREAFECWRTQSVRIPTRPDGRPNRPLTAYTVEVRAAEPTQ